MSIYDQVIKVGVVTNPTRHRTVDLYFYQDVGNDSVRLLRFNTDKDGTTSVSTEVKPYFSSYGPSLQLPQELLEPLMAALTEARIKPPSHHKVEGLYEAQSKHLADLRTLLKLDKGGK